MLTPEQYLATPVYELLTQAAEGRIGFDHRLIRAIVDRPADAIPDLVKWGSEDHEETPLDLTDDLVNLFRHLKTPEAIPFYVRTLKGNPTDVPDELGQALYEVREHAVEPLLKLYGELEEDEAGEVAFILASFRKHDPRILNILLDRLEYDAGDGALSLGLYGDPSAQPALEKLLGDIGESEPHLKTDLQDAIQQLGRPVEETDFEFNIWDEYPKEAPPIFDLLDEPDRLQMLSSDSARFRAEAVTSFINRDLSDEARNRIYALAKSDPDPDVRANCWEALSGEIEEHPEIRKSMFERLSDASLPEVERAGALVGLAREAKNPEIRSFAEEFYHNESTRAKAMEAMWRSLDRSFAEYFPQHLDDSDEETKRQAIWGVGYLGITASSEKLVPFFDDEEFRADALFAYALSARHEISKARIHGLYRKIEELSGGLSHQENELVELALDERLMLHGHKPVFFPEHKHDHEHEHVHGPECAHDHDHAQAPAGQPDFSKVGRNDPCPCGSGQKFKKCHGAVV